MQSDFQKKTDSILAKAEADGVDKAFCVGISENLLTFLGRNIESIKPKIFDIEGVENTEFKVSPYEGVKFRDNFLPCVFKIDSENKSIDVFVSLRMSFYDTKDPTLSVATIEFTTKLSVEPFMATQNKNHLAFNINEAQLDGGIVYLLNSDEVIKRFGSIFDFKQYVQSIIDQILDVNVESDFNSLLPSVFSRMELPNTWDYVEGYSVEFKDFYYEKGLLSNSPSSFLFVLFSVKSLMLPPQCQCSNNLQGNIRVLEDNISSGPMSKYADVFTEEDHWITVGVSQSSIKEIFQPYSQYSQRTDHAFAIRKGIAFGEVSYWFQIHAYKVTITPSGLDIEINIDSKGSITGYPLNPVFGGKYGFEAANFQLVIDSISTHPKIKSRNNNERWGQEVYVKPNVDISDPELQIHDPIPWPITELIKLLIDRFSDDEKKRIKDKMKKYITVPLFLSRVTAVGDFGFFFLGDDYYENSSIVITGRGTDD
ncbi:hypothetical protein [Wukongibacter baidiensis]